MEETIFDPLRKKYVALTPEERVRQYFIRWLTAERNYPLGLMASEYTIKLGRKTLRCDIVVFNRQLHPQIIVECKAPEVKLSNEVLSQAIGYNKVLNVEHIVITNGENTIICSKDSISGKYVFTADLPFYSSR